MLHYDFTFLFKFKRKINAFLNASKIFENENVEADGHDRDRQHISFH